ncbi:MAG: GNAT family N-acetyltransferase [Deltaproteobacteria bacterium]|nr:GNAT family N-acetyltransferase [Deltaproteobacteria bacterium]
MAIGQSRVDTTAVSSAFFHLETARLQLSPVQVADAAEMSRVLSDPALYTFTGGAPETEVELATRYTRWVAGATQPGQTWVNLIARERTTGHAIGYVQATVNPDIADIAWVIGTPWQRKGYAVEAARALVAHVTDSFHVATIRALIKAEHVASQRIAERLGMRLTDDVVRGEQVWIRKARGD